MLYVAGEHIPAGSAVVISHYDGQAYANGHGVTGKYLGNAVEELREGFRICERDGEVREDDA
jgi:hypothetical protein